MEQVIIDGKSDINKIINDCLYLNYRYNRDRSPDITPEGWKVVFGNKVDQFEVLYQADRILGSTGLCP